MTDIKIGLTPEQLLEADRIKREKKAEANKKYRLNLKKGTSKRSELTYEEYNDKKTEYMREYRKKRRIALIEARAELPEAKERPEVTQKKVEKVNKKFNLAEARRSTRQTKQVDLSIAPRAPIVKKKIVKKIIPLWIRNLPLNPTEDDYREAKKYPDKVKNVMITKIETVFTKVLKLDFTKQCGQILSKILSGFRIQGDLKHFKKLFPFLEERNLLTFVNKVQDYYPKVTSFTTMILPFVNVLARLMDDGYAEEYQQLSLIAKESAKEYNADRDKNAVSEEDAGKIFSFDPDDVEFHIDNFLTEVRDKALAAIYALQPPRRLLDFQYMKPTEITNVDLLSNEDLNYLVVENGEPLFFVYNRYKTERKYGQQVIEIEPEVIPYLKDWLRQGKFLPLRGSGMYLFGTKTSDNKQVDSNFGTLVKNTFYRMYGEEITVRWIRASAASWYNNLSPKPDLEDRKLFAWKMAHSRGLNEQYEKIIVDEKEEDDDGGKKVKPSKKADKADTDDGKRVTRSGKKK